MAKAKRKKRPLKGVDYSGWCYRSGLDGSLYCGPYTYPRIYADKPKLPPYEDCRRTSARGEWVRVEVVVVE